MLGILGILVSLLLLIFLAYRGWNVIIIAPICALVGLLLGDFEAPILATYTQVFMPALGNYLIKFFPLFLLGAVFGKLMDDSGCARTIAHKIVEWTGKERAIIAIILACGVLTYGGVSLFVVAFAVFPVAIQMFREGNLPKRLIPATIALGSFTFTMSALPGSPAIQNAIPMPFFHTDAFAAPGLGVIAGVMMFACGSMWLTMRARSARNAGEGFGAEAPATPAAPTAMPAGELPSFAVAIIPVVLVLAINFIFSKYFIQDIDTSYLATPKYGENDGRGRRWHLGDHRGDDLRLHRAPRPDLEALPERSSILERGCAGLDAADPQRRLGGGLRCRDCQSGSVCHHKGLADVTHRQPGGWAGDHRQRSRRHYRLGLRWHEHRPPGRRAAVP
jgi:hypothetical protein